MKTALATILLLSLQACAPASYSAGRESALRGASGAGSFLGDAAGGGGLGSASRVRPVWIAFPMFQSSFLRSFGF